MTLSEPASQEQASSACGPYTCCCSPTPGRDTVHTRIPSRDGLAVEPRRSKTTRQLMRRAAHLQSRRCPCPRLRAHATVGTLIAAGALVAGCGGGSNPGVANVSASRASSSHSSSTYDQALAYARCVRSHGVPLWPDPDSSGRFDKSKLRPRQLGVSVAKAGTAQHACRKLLPTPSTAESPQDLAQALRFSQCMRAHGSTNFPDPESNGAIRIPHAIENSPMYLAALNFCIHRYGVPPPPPSAGAHS
jgi:hypothetical protein